MKKIERAMCEALENRTPWAGGNTTLTIDEETGLATVRLHGHKIFAKTRGGKSWFRIAGWNTVTTRSRLRALGVQITTKDFAPYVGGVPVMDEHLWHHVDRRGYLVMRGNEPITLGGLEGA